MKLALFFEEPLLADTMWELLGKLTGVVSVKLHSLNDLGEETGQWTLLTETDVVQSKGWLSSGNSVDFAAVAVVDMDGDLDAESLPAPFTLLPFPISLRDLQRLVESGPPASPDNLAPTILVAEDSALQRSVVVSTLRAEGFNVLEAENGRKALELLDEHHPDVIVTDVEMPEMTGFELTRAVRKHPKVSSVPIIILTTLSEYEQMKEGFDAGATDYLVKPKKGERESFLSSLLEHIYQQLQLEKVVAGRKALCVDDSGLTRKMVAEALTQAGFDVTALENGALAMEYLQSEDVVRPDLVVTDLEMPEVDGLRLTHFIKHTPSLQDIPVVILSGTTRGDHRTLGKGFGADAFLSKPFTNEKLQVTVEQVLGRQHLEKERKELSRIIGRDVIEAVHKGGLAPRKQEVTVFFSDIAGFSSMCSRKTAGEVVELLNEYFDILVEHASRNQGYVNKFIGDAMVALYSKRPGLAPPAERCVATAVGIQRAMRAFNADRPEPLHTRIGINTGEVIMGLIGSGERKDYTVIGDHVNRAQRFEGKAPVKGILISEETYQAALGYIERQDDLTVEVVENLELKGIGHPLTAYALHLKSEE